MNCKKIVSTIAPEEALIRAIFVQATKDLKNKRTGSWHRYDAAKFLFSRIANNLAVEIFNKEIDLESVKNLYESN